MFLFDDENDDSRLSVLSIKTTTPQDGGSANRLTEGTVPESDTPFPRLDSIHSTPLTTDVPRTPGSIRRVAINLLSKPKQNKAVPQDERDMKLPLPEIMMDLPEGTERGSEPGEIVEVLHKSYDHCEGPKAADRGSNSVKMADIPPASPAKMLSVIQDTSPASTTSMLSPVPSTLSDHGNDEGIKVRFSVCEDHNTNLYRSRAQLPHKATQACLQRQQRRKARRLAALHKKSPKRRRGRLRTSPAHQSGRRKVSKSLRCSSFTRARFCAKAVLGSLLGRRSREGTEKHVIKRYALRALDTQIL